MSSKLFIFLSAFLFCVLSFSIVSACDVGELNSESGQYCDSSGVWKSLIADNEACLGDYECVSGSCVESICQDVASALNYGLDESFFNRLVLEITGRCSNVGGYRCDSVTGIYYQCGTGNSWEVIGSCGGDGDSGDGSSSGGSDGGIVPSSSSGGCRVNWVCTEWGACVGGNQTRTCTKTPKFCYAGKMPEVNKGCTQEIIDVPSQPVYVCGDGACSLGESSVTCADDCEAKKPKKNWGLIAIMSIVIISLLGGISFLVYKIIQARRLRASI